VSSATCWKTLLCIYPDPEYFCWHESQTIQQYSSSRCTVALYHFSLKCCGHLYDVCLKGVDFFQIRSLPILSPSFPSLPLPSFLSLFSPVPQIKLVVWGNAESFPQWSLGKAQSHQCRNCGWWWFSVIVRTRGKTVGYSLFHHAKNLVGPTMG